MRSRNQRPVRPALVIGLILLAGCAELPKYSWFGKPATSADGTPVVPTPSDYLAELKATASHADRLSETERQEISAQLCQGLRTEQDVLLRCQVLETLAALKTEQGDAMLRVGLQDPDRDVRVVCCDAWGCRGSEEAVRLMSTILANDADPDVRMAAARALGKLGDRQGIEALGAALQDNDPALQHCAVASLREITGENLGADVNAWIAYVQQGAPEREISLAERLFRWY